ncbi:MAG TPA: DUF1998 domain-containing protein, partial [Brevibacterium senegalense]|nr:DUF1998 domain-containing protein [Brevibacterium senegalense]
LLEEFLAGFGDQIELAAHELRAWASPGEDGTSGLSRTVWAAHRDYLKRRETLTRRVGEIQPLVARLQAQEIEGHLPEEEKEPLQQARSALRATKRALTDMQAQDWVSALEAVQLLPNYTLLDDSTDLDVIARWRDDETAEWREDSLTFGRGARVALRDFAPGSTFYGRGLQVRVDAVDLGAANEDVYTLAFCSACGFTHDSREARVTEDGTAAVPQQCPRCGSAGIADRGQRVDAVQFRRAMSMINRDEAGINDRDDDRAMTMYSLVSLADIDPASIASRWYTPGLDFGIAHLSRVRITTVNLGQQRRARPAVIAGEEMALSLFTICESCGVLDRSSGENSRKEHRPWCPLRDARDEKTVSIALTHLLDTQGALLRLPHELVTGDHLTVPSLMAALQVGLREELGGEPDHISLLRTQEPLEGGGVVEALLLHDVVPGGTGYLADLCRPEKLWKVLAAAYRVVRDCVCAGTEIACAQCLLPFVPPGADGMVSRQSAETTLATLLRAGRAVDGAEVDPTSAGRARGDVSHDGTRGAANGAGGLGDGLPWTGWEVTTETPDRPADESALEGKFRAVMRERLTHVGYHVRETAMSTGTGLTFTLPQSQLRWRLVPQVAQGFVKPDFMLECASPQVPDVAVFTDGYAYHASPAHTIVADDARKRADLRSRNGWPVVSIAHADVVASAMTDGSVAGAAGGAVSAGGADDAGARAGFWGQWHAQVPPERIHALKARKGANGQRMLTWPDGAEAFLAGPVEILLQWILTIDEAQTSGGARGIGAGFGSVGRSPVDAAVGAVRAFADSAVWMLGVGRAGVPPQPVLLDASAGAFSVALQVAGELTQEAPLARPESQVPDSRWQMAFLLREGPLGILFAPDPDGSGRARMVVVLDDRESAVGTQGFRDAWISWLHLNTLLSF